MFRTLGASNVNIVKRTFQGQAMEWPFSGHLPKTLNVGDKIEIEGTIADDAETFSINLVCEHDLSMKPHNVAYHHKMMFQEGRTILNSKHNGSWQDEEDSDESYVTPGERFTFMMVIMDDGIFAYCNNVHHSTFTHRLPIEEIRYVQIWHGLGQIESMKVTFA